MAWIWEAYEKILSEFEAEVGDNPDADFTPSIQKLAARLTRMGKRSEKRLINTLFLDLYGRDAAASLRKDLCSLEVSGTSEDPSSHRTKLLMYLYDGALSWLFEEIVSGLWQQTEEVVFSHIPYDCMKISDLKREFPGKICICRPQYLSNGVFWDYLLAVESVDAARVALELFDTFGEKWREAVPISTTDQITLTGDLAARYDRVFDGTEQ